MTRLLLVLNLFFFSHLYLEAQNFPSEIWHDGTLITIEDDTLQGDIKYNIDADLIQVRAKNGVISAFSSRKILYFEIFDTTIDNYRLFYSLPYALKTSYQVPVLFEVLHEGRLSLLGREKIVQDFNPYYGLYGRAFYGDRFRLDYDYYFLAENGRIQKYNLKKKELLKIMGKRSSEVKLYAKKNKLKYDRLADLVRITSYYNALEKK
jgi:hypothetical protein